MKTFDLAVQSRNSDLVECLKPAALSLACREGDVNRVQSLINKYNCDPKGLWYSIVDVRVYLPSDEVMVQINV